MRNFIINLITKILEYAIFATTAAAVIILAINVFLRYALNRPFSWAEEVSVLLMIWFTFFAASLLQKNEEHVSVTYVFDHLPTKIKKIITIFGSFCVCSVLMIHFLSSLNLVKLQIKTFTPALRVSMKYFSLPILISMAVMLIYTIDSTIKKFKNV